MCPEISIVIPAYNEEERIAATIDDIHSSLRQRGADFEIVVVDDGSEDGTVSLVRRLARAYPELSCVATRPNRGKGHAVRIGMLAARGRIRLMCDADGSMPAREIPTLLDPIRRGECDVAIGSRYAPGARTDVAQPLWRRLWSRLANALVRATVVGGIRDTQCGFKAMTATAAEAVFRRARLDGWAFDLELLALASRLGLEISELPVAWSDDGRSRVSPLRDLRVVVGEWWRLSRNLRRDVYALTCPEGSASLPAASVR